MQFQNKRIVISGASSGIGWALLNKLRKIEGIQLVAVDIKPLPETYEDVTFIRADMSNLKEIENVFAQTCFKFSEIDIFFANAGFAYYESVGLPDYERIDKIFKVNTVAPLYILQKMMEMENDNLTVVTASAMAKLGVPGYALYGATKAAIDRFADAFWYENHPTSKLSLVYPVATRTNFFKEANKKDTPVTPWPSQTAEQVADAIIAGVKNDKKQIFPSALFQGIRFPQWFYETINRPYQKYYAKYLK
jgi:short-subunit dehydrogenase